MFTYVGHLEDETIDWIKLPIQVIAIEIYFVC